MSDFPEFLFILPPHFHLKSLIISLFALSSFLLFLRFSFHGSGFVDVLQLLLFLGKVVVILTIDMIFLGFELISVVENLVVLLFLFLFLLFFKFPQILSLSQFLLGLPFLKLQKLLFPFSLNQDCLLVV